MAIDISGTIVNEPLPPDVSLAIYRIAQEALHNVEKHSQAQHVTIKVERTSDGVALTIRDDGVGFDTDHLSSAGLGVESMRARITSVAGWLHISSAPNKGTRVDAFAPLPHATIELAKTG